MIVARRAAVLAVALVLAGCGSNNTPAPTPLATSAPAISAASSASASAPSAAPAAAQLLVQYYLPAGAGTKLAVTNTNLDTGLDAGDHALGKQGQYAFDFGTGNNAPFTVVAARAGTVIGLQRDSTTQCKGLNTDIDGTADPGCWTKANYVLVDQGDHTAGLYMHLAPDSVPAGLEVGSPVCLGTPLGTDGQTGWATGPHVHFQVEAKPTVPVPTAANPSVTDPNAIQPGWWWADSQRITQGFSDPDVLAKAPSGIPPRGAYTSGNFGTGCPGDAAPPAAPTITASWVAPKDGAKLTTSALTLSAKPTVTPTTLSIAKVAFSATWGSTSKAACAATKAGSGGVWSCAVDLWGLGVVPGTVTFSFDAMLSDGSTVKAPAGTRRATLAAGAELLPSSSGCHGVVAGIDQSGGYHAAGDCSSQIRYWAAGTDGRWSTTKFSAPARGVQYGPMLAFLGSTEYVIYTLAQDGEAGCGSNAPPIAHPGVYYRRRSLPSGGWSAPVQVGKDYDALVALRGGGGKLYLGVYGNAGLLYIETVAGGSVSRVATPDFYGGVFRVGSDGALRLAFTGSSGLRYGTFTGSKISSQPVPGADSPDHPSGFVLGPGGVPYIAIVRDHAGGGGCATPGPDPSDGVYVAMRSSGKWSLQRITKDVGPAAITVNGATSRVYVLVAGASLRLYQGRIGSWASSGVSSRSVTSPVLLLDSSTGGLLIAYALAGGSAGGIYLQIHGL